MALQMTGAPSHPELVDLPWDVPLESWPVDQLVGLPRGISRHVVRFVRVGRSVVAVKEIGTWSAEREYALLRALGRARGSTQRPAHASRRDLPGPPRSAAVTSMIASLPDVSSGRA